MTDSDSNLFTEEAGDSRKEPLPKRILGLCVRFLLPLALTILLVAYMFRKVNFSDMMGIIRQGVDYWWILAAMGLSVFSHMFRAARWRLQLRAIGVDAPFLALCCSIFGCYALNLVFPRLGEVWRCTYIARRERSSFTTIFGSMVADRLADSLMVLLLLGLTFVVATKAITSFLTKYPIGVGLIDLITNPWLWVVALSCLIIVVLTFRYFRATSPVRKIMGMLRELQQGFTAVLTMKGRGRFLLLTVAIWGCYYVQLYVAFFAFGFTADLCRESSLAFGLTPCLVAFVLSSIGMAIPSNGGLGPWNIAVMFGLAIYGVTDAQGTAFSMLQWSGQTVMLILLGVFTMIYISLSPKRKALPEASPDVKG